MSTNQHYLNIENVVKQFGQFTALKQISLAIEKGELFVFWVLLAAVKLRYYVPLQV